MRYVIGGNVMLDSVRFAGEKEYSRESIGGPATFAYSGVKLFTDDVMQCSRLGEDYHELFDDWVARNGVETKGFKVVSARCNHSYLVYNADGTYGSEKFMQSVAQMGEWMQTYGTTIRATEAGDVPVQEWGATTRRGDTLYVHILNYDRRELYLPLQCRVVKATTFADGKRVGVTKTAEGVVLNLPEVPQGYDYVVELQTKEK